MRSEGRTGFTLVELLVVISIITVLAALLLPALRKSILAAQQLQCMSKQKNLGAAFFFYADDNGGYFPDVYWCKIKKYLDIPGTGTSYYTGGGYTNCPNAPEKNESGEPLYVTYGFSGNGNPTTNYFCTQNSANMPNGRPWRSHCVKSSRVQQPSTRFLLTEYWMGHFYGTDYYWKWVSYRHHNYCNMRKVHDSGSNVYYADGHVTNYTLPGELYEPAASGLIPDEHYRWK